MTSPSPARPVIIDHDGSLDDLLSLLLLTKYDSVDLIGASVTPADCLLEPAVAATRKILALANRPHVPVAPGHLHGRNPFPMAWRTDALRVNALPVLNQRPEMTNTNSISPPAHRQLADWLGSAPAPVTLLFTGPLTNLAWCLEHHPELESAIAEVVLMGGAFDVPGNVDQKGHDGTAEWNIFWDPEATMKVFASTVPITLVPLDVTNQVPVTLEFTRSFGNKYGNATSDLAGILLAMTFGTIETTGLPYCCWDTLTTAYLSEPKLFSFEETHCQVITLGPSEGRTVRCDAGRLVKRAVAVDRDGFYEHCLRNLV